MSDAVRSSRCLKNRTLLAYKRRMIGHGANPPNKGRRMAAKNYLLAMIFVTFSYASASGATNAIGTVSARGDFRVDGNSVWGNGTLFDGTTVETGQATATLRLANGTEIMLA